MSSKVSEIEEKIEELKKELPKAEEEDKKAGIEYAKVKKAKKDNFMRTLAVITGIVIVIGSAFTNFPVEIIVVGVIGTAMIISVIKMMMIGKWIALVVVAIVVIGWFTNLISDVFSLLAQSWWTPFPAAIICIVGTMLFGWWFMSKADDAIENIERPEISQLAFWGFLGSLIFSIYNLNLWILGLSIGVLFLVPKKVERLISIHSIYKLLTVIFYILIAGLLAIEIYNSNLSLQMVWPGIPESIMILWNAAISNYWSIISTGSAFVFGAWFFNGLFNKTLRFIEDHLALP